jgi:peptidoglycan hydrolase-like protein with peptidoglycan-binding domain
MSIHVQTKSQAGTKSSAIPPVHSVVQRPFSHQRGFTPVAEWKPNKCEGIEVRHQLPARIQTKLTIGEPGDKYEQEADRVADQVMRMPDPVDKQFQPYATLDQQPSIQRFCPESEEEVQRQAMEEEEEEVPSGIAMLPLVAGSSSGGVEAYTQTLGRGGRPLPDSLRPFFESRFGYDFAQVRIHTDSQANQAARAVNARAFTLGHIIVFGSNQYAPHTNGGKRLLSHELTHVLQQRGMSLRRKVQVDQENGPLTQAGGSHLNPKVGGSDAIAVSHRGKVASAMIQRQPLTANRGDVGCPVPELQEKLNVTGARLVVDGHYGALTQAAVQAFQATQPFLGILATPGQVDLVTRNFLDAAAPGNHGLPAGETTHSRGWGTGNRATVHRWRQRLSPRITSFRGCRVTEADPGGGTDGCHFPGSAIPAQTLVTGGTWVVNARNQWGDDWVGWLTPGVNYYRTQGRAPCSVRLPQSMRVVRPAGDVEYLRHNIIITIGTTTVSVTRAGQTRTRRWP